jgi:predicted GIY-YIG superfamily endonuclease
LATELSKEHTLWEKAMVVVLVSRVHAAIDLIFVGNKEDNIGALIEGLRLRNQYDEYMDHVVDILTQRRGFMEAISLDHHPFRFKDIPLPMDTSGVVYMLVSIRTSASMYIGSTRNMANRLRQHNTGYGAMETAPPENRPYGLYCYITGFSGDKDLMTTVERRWQTLVRTTKPDTCKEAAALALRMVKRDFQRDSFVVVVADTL